MRRSRVLKVVATAAALSGAGALAAGCSASPAVEAARVAAGAAGPWGRAIEVPGLGALNKAGDAEVTSVSCASAGNCAAGGYYDGSQRVHHLHQQGFVASERRGRWGKAIEVPGLGALNEGGADGPEAEVSEVSCGAAGSCVAGGYYTDGDGRQQAFVAVERNGRWGKAAEVPGLGALTSGDAGAWSVSCVSAGTCEVAGLYLDRGGQLQIFAVSQRQGRWGKAAEVPGLGALNAGGGSAGWSPDLSELSCASAGDCAAGGFYTDQAGNQQGYVATERDGRWAKAIEVPGLGTLNKGFFAEVSSVSCGAPGNCAAAGDYVDGSDTGQGFVAVERDGHWGNAMNVPGLRRLNDGNAEVDSVSCASAGGCSAAGTFGNPYGSVFVVSAKNGVWGKAADLATPAARLAGESSVSCASPGYCAAGGYYSNSSGNVTQGFVAVERHGRWRGAIKVPGLTIMNKGGDADVESASCAPESSCAAGGYYTDGRGHSQGFVVSQAG